MGGPDGVVVVVVVLLVSDDVDGGVAGDGPDDEEFDPAVGVVEDPAPLG